MPRLHSVPNFFCRLGVRVACVATVLLMMVTFACAPAALAQQDKADRQHQKQLRDAMRRESWIKNFNIQSYLKEQDKDQDGIITPKEVSNRRTKRLLNRLGVNVTKPQPIPALVSSYKQKRAKETQEQRAQFEKKLYTLATFGTDTDSLGVNRFGVDSKSDGVETFDNRATGLKASQFEADILKQADKRLRAFDRDNNGFLDGDEISRIKWQSPPPETSDLNRDGRLSKLELANRFQTRQASKPNDQNPNSAQGKGKGKESPGSTGGESPSGQTAQRAVSHNSTSSFGGSKLTKPQLSSTAKSQNYVDEQYAKYDANRDGKLDQDELKKTRMFRKAVDANQDGFLDKREAVAFVSGGQSKRPQKSSSFPMRSRTSSSMGMGFYPSSTDGRKLSDVDRNADGQIEMHEYTNEWTTEKLNEFRSKDKNEDGILSRAEWSSPARQPKGDDRHARF